MRKAVLYDSNTGNTEAMAEAIAEGARSVGDEVYLSRADRADLDEALSCDLLYLGCPAMGVEMVGDALTDLCRTVGGRFNGRKVALFGSYGRGTGQWIRAWSSELQAYGAEMISGSGLKSFLRPNDEVLRECRDLGMYRFDPNADSYGRRMEQKSELLSQVPNAIARKDFSLASDLLEKAVGLDPSDPEIRVGIIECIYRRNRGLFPLFDEGKTREVKEIYAHYSEYLKNAESPRSLKDLIQGFRMEFDGHSAAVRLMNELRSYERQLTLGAIWDCFHTKVRILAGGSHEYLMFWPDYREKLQMFHNLGKFDFFVFPNSPYMAVIEIAEVIRDLKRCISAETVWVRDEIDYLMSQALKGQPESKSSVADRYRMMACRQIRILDAISGCARKCFETGRPPVFDVDSVSKTLDCSDIYLRSGKLLGLLDRTKTAAVDPKDLLEETERFYCDSVRKYEGMFARVESLARGYYEDFSENRYTEHPVSIAGLYSKL